MADGLPLGCILVESGGALRLGRTFESKGATRWAFPLLSLMFGAFALLFLAAGLGWIPNEPEGGGIEGSQVAWVALLPGLMATVFLHAYLWERYGVQEAVVRRGEIRFEWGWGFSTKRGSFILQDCELKVRAEDNSEGIRSVDLIAAPAHGTACSLWKSLGESDEEEEIVALGELLAKRTGWRLSVSPQPRQFESQRWSGKGR
jgi:hypothetical protein